ncbi:MAG: nitroreductase [Proteobacteria bacterium]|nr:nitroreductase [Pseudomonadota bacterium]MBU4471584.1 nitroreductase [Pseudomonadota bacterium]MCG2752590.1 nitroreductase [Desulfobacteraceae bacterium]
MDLIQAIQSRKSIRGYKPDPVPKEILKGILEIAGRAPSAMNTQPWEFFVLGGEVLKNVAEGNVRNLKEGVVPKGEHSVVGWTVDSVYRTRQVELAKELFRLMDIERGDNDKRGEWMERGFRFFDAPVAIILTADKSLAESTPLIDVGIVIQNICLAALNFGLGTCIEDQGVLYPDVLRQHADIPDSKRLIMAIALGYPDWTFPANRINSSRVSLDSNTYWRGI